MELAKIIFALTIKAAHMPEFATEIEELCGLVPTKENYMPSGFGTCSRANLIAFWHNKTCSNPGAKALADQVWDGYQEHLKNQPQLPSYPRMATNLAKAGVEDAMALMPRRTLEEANRILQTFCANEAEPCEKYRAKDRRCSECGCYVRVKASMETQHCPLGKW